MSINSCSNFLITVLDDSFCNGIQKGKLENLSTIIKNFFPLHSKTSVDNFSNGLLAYVLTTEGFEGYTTHAHGHGASSSTLFEKG